MNKDWKTKIQEDFPFMRQDGGEEAERDEMPGSHAQRPFPQRYGSHSRLLPRPGRPPGNLRLHGHRPRSAQKAMEAAAATFRESIPRDMGILTT